MARHRLRGLNWLAGGVAAFALLCLSSAVRAADYNCESGIAATPSCSMTTGQGLVATSATDASFGDLPLGTGTSGNYVATVADGTGIDGTATGEGSTYTPTFDATELGTLTWYNGTGSVVHTFNTSGAEDVAEAYNNDYWEVGVPSAGDKITYVPSTGVLTMEGASWTLDSSGAGDVTFSDPVTVATSTADADKIKIQPQTATATGTFTGTITSVNLTADRTWTHKDASGTICLESNCLASTATALAANGANCSAGQAPLGVDAAGAVEGCFTPTAAAPGTDGQLPYNDGGSAFGASIIVWNDINNRFETVDADYVIKLDSDNDSTQEFQIYDGGGTERLSLTEAGSLDLTGGSNFVALGGGGSDTFNLVRNDTADGSDNEYLCLAGGGACSNSRGAIIQLGGNEPAIFSQGQVSIDAGNVAEGEIYLKTSNATKATVERDGDLKLVNQLTFNGTVPTVGTCGTTPSIAAASNDNAGLFTTGTGSPTACTVTFAKTWDSTPSCVANYQGGTTGVRASSISTTAVTFTYSAGCSSCVTNYICMGYQ